MSFGRLERRAQSAPMSEINMTPLIDVMLVLLVIFIITAPLMVSAVKVNLPQAQGADAAVNTPQALQITINSQGQLFFNDRPLAPDALAQALQKAAAANADTEIELRADSAVPYGQVAQFMALAQKAGLSRIGFVTDEPAPAPKIP